MPSPKPIEPHPPLPDYYADQAERPSFVRGLFDRTAAHYDVINRVSSMGTGDWYRRRVLIRAGLQPGLRVLDVATGTGLVARQAIAITGDHDNVVGLDVSAGMLKEARRTLAMPLLQGRAEQLAIADNRFDFLTLGYALRHLAGLDTAFREFHRVLKPGGTVVILEIGKPVDRWRRAIMSFYIGRVVPFVSRWLTREEEARTLMRYYWDTIDQCVPPATIVQALTDAGFTAVRCDEEFGMFRAYSGRKD